MEGHNERHTPVKSDGKLSVVLENCDGTSSVAPQNPAEKPCKYALKGLLCQLMHSHSYSHTAVKDGKRICWTDDLRICSEMDMRFFPHPHPEQLADAWDEAPTRRAWWLDLHSSADLHAGTTISDLHAAVGRTAGSKTLLPANGSNGQPAAAPVFISDRPFDCPINANECDYPLCVIAGSPFATDSCVAEEMQHRNQKLNCSALTMPVCECSQPVASLRPFDWQCAKCKGVIPSPYRQRVLCTAIMSDEQRRDYLEAL